MFRSTRDDREMSTEREKTPCQVRHGLAGDQAYGAQLAEISMTDNLAASVPSSS